MNYWPKRLIEDVIYFLSAKMLLAYSNSNSCLHCIFKTSLDLVFVLGRKGNNYLFGLRYLWRLGNTRGHVDIVLQRKAAFTKECNLQHFCFYRSSQIVFNNICICGMKIPKPHFILKQVTFFKVLGKGRWPPCSAQFWDNPALVLDNCLPVRFPR